MRALATFVVLAVILLSAPLASAAVVGGGAGAGNGVNGNGNGNGNNGNNNNSNNAPPSVVGQVFEIAISDGTTKTLSRISFKTKDLSCDFIAKWNIQQLPYTEDAGKGKTVSFTGKVADASGNGLTLSGTVTGTAIEGTIDVTKKGGESQSYTFTGGAPGSQEAKEARIEVEKAKAGTKKK